MLKPLESEKEKLALDKIVLTIEKKNIIQLSKDITLTSIYLKDSVRAYWDNGWNIRIDFGSSKYFSFILTGVISGCGSGFIGNFNSTYHQELDYEIIFKIVNELLQSQSNNWGSVITTFGSELRNIPYDKYYKLLVDLGFKSISKYTNNQHGSTDKQNLLQLILKKA